MENSERDGNTRPPDLLLKNLYAAQEATIRTGHGTTDWFQIGKGVYQGCILLLCLFNLYAEYSMRNARLDEAQLESRLLGEIPITSDMQMTPPLCQKVKRNLMKVKEVSEKLGLKLNFQKMEIMASVPITSRQINGETMQTVRETLFSPALKTVQMVTAAMKFKDTCSLEEKL